LFAEAGRPGHLCGMTELPVLSVSPAVRAADPRLTLGLLLADVRVGPRGEALDAEIAEACAACASRESADSIKAWPTVAAARAAYKALGKDPSRYRPSAEALLRRVVTGKGIYRVSNAVDALNLVSLRTGLSIGGYDAATLEPPLHLERGGQEPYEAIGRGALNVAGLPVLYDARGPFGSPTSDSTRTMVGPGTRRFLWVVFGFGGAGSVEGSLEQAAESLVRHASGECLARAVLPPEAL
jgi:DNA/RNA-binding domain of Phe-tRNA-synthetase-like protein